jgi:hypothetical protein
MKKILIIGAIIGIIIAGFVVSGLGNQNQTDTESNAHKLGDNITNDQGYASFDGQGPAYGPGPAPNSHDGIPDGPGWE